MEQTINTKAETMNTQEFTLVEEYNAEERVDMHSLRRRDITIKAHTNYSVIDSNGRTVAKYNATQPLKTATMTRIQVLPSEDFPYPLSTPIFGSKKDGFKLNLENGIKIEAASPIAIWKELIATQYSL